MQHDFILLDRSGSMKQNWNETISAVNSYVKSIAEKNVDTGVTLVCFDKEIGDMSFDILRDRIIPTTWKEVGTTEAPPRGYTPLNDATARIVSMAKAGNYEKVVIIIVTDGMENASKEYPGYEGTAKIKKMLDDCRAKNWQVIFLGADFDNATQAMNYGNASQNTAQMASGNMRATMSSLSGTRSIYGATGQSMDFSDEEKQKFKKGKSTNPSNQSSQ